MKRLTRIRLINWHYFVNETISVNGSFLISGENTAGKSTVLDAIQLVLTTNQRRFNIAANEKSKRDLKGYVRCKTGNEDGAYLRKGTIITYVALEFFDEKSGKAFVIGCKIDSPSEEERLDSRWYVEECRLEDLRFITDNHPSLSEEFRRGDRRVTLIAQTKEAKERFRHRLGKLEERFFEMIPKALAFKPMDNVKDFINKFILPEKNIEVETLRRNITALKELEDLMTQTKAKIHTLEEILSIGEQIELKEKDIKVHDLLLKRSELAVIEGEIEGLEKKRNLLMAQVQQGERQLTTQEATVNRLDDQLIQLRVAAQNDEIGRLIDEIKRTSDQLKKQMEQGKQDEKRLQQDLRQIKDTLVLLQRDGKRIFDVTSFEALYKPIGDEAIKNAYEYLQLLDKALNGEKESYGEAKYSHKQKLEGLSQQKQSLESQIKNLKNKKLDYPKQTLQLKEAIEEAFKANSIRSDVHIFSNLLEITDPRWQNAVEGYLNTQRFYLIVEPKHYKLALEVYHKLRQVIHSVGLINTEKLRLEGAVDHDSLAYTVHSENRYAKAYALYLLNRVIRVDSIHLLKDHPVAITDECMLYQNYAVRKIHEEVYRTPFIGARAYEIQLQQAETAYEGVKRQLQDEKERLAEVERIHSMLSNCRIDLIKERIHIPNQLTVWDKDFKAQSLDLRKAQDNPSYIQLQLRIQEVEENSLKEKQSLSGMQVNQGKTEAQLEEANIQHKRKTDEIYHIRTSYEALTGLDEEITNLALAKYADQIKTKEPQTIIANFTPYRNGLFNKKLEQGQELILKQTQFISKYEVDLNTGATYLKEYREEHYRLTASEIIKFEEDLKKAMDNCHLEFRESFLARLKEYIETAQSEFKNLNRALKDVYYGEDSYRFDYSANKTKESIHRMIMDKDNTMGYTLWSQGFEAEFKEEMEDLFSKLTAFDDKGEKVLSEYTDYRNYMDYDIVVDKKDGSSQRFSKIYGEKSGGETQTPYYVAIAASFSQLYKLGDTIRIIMFDEAFDKMDDNRIASMMDFLNHLDFQIILATPPAKVEVIGEKVDTILMAMREGSASIIETYDL